MTVIRSILTKCASLEVAPAQSFLIGLLLEPALLLTSCSSPSSDSLTKPTVNSENTAISHDETVSAAQSDASRCQNSLIIEAFKAQRSDVQVKGCGRVIKLLADDVEGSRHQKFLVALTGEQAVKPHTVLIAHNIDLAPRVETLKQGSEVFFYGEYDYNAKGGVVHWTHHDPAARHQDGWLELAGQRYE